MSFKYRALAWGCVVGSLCLVATSQAAQVKLDFEDLGLAAPITGTPVGDTFRNQGFTFTSQASAFHSGTDDAAWQSGPPTHSGSFGFVSNSFGRGFTINVLAGFNFGGLTMDYAVASQPFRIEVVSRADGTGVVKTATRDVSAALSNWVWTENDEIANAGFGLIDRIDFISANGFLAIDNLSFTVAAPGASVSEPAGFGLVALALAGAGAATRRRKVA